MEVAIIASFALAGAIWRRWLGGWGGGRRSVRFIVVPLLCLPLWVGLWPSPHLWVAVVVTGILTASWADGHEWTDPKAMLYRYSLAPTLAAAILVAAYGLPALAFAMTGPAIALAYWSVQRWWPDRWRAGGWIDGPIAVAELAAGTVIYGGLAALVALDMPRITH